VLIVAIVVSLGLNYLQNIGFAFVNSYIKKIRRCEQGDYRYKMTGTGFHSVVANRAPIPRFATAGITPWQNSLVYRGVPQQV
jgi:hypothetical protein